MPSKSTQQSPTKRHNQIWLVVSIIIAVVAIAIALGLRLTNTSAPVSQSGQVDVVLTSDKEGNISASDTIKLNMIVTNGTSEDINYLSSSTCDKDSITIDGQFAGPIKPCTADLREFVFKPGDVKEFDYTVSGEKISANCSKVQGKWSDYKSNEIVLCQK